MGGTQDKPKEPGKGSEAQEHHRSGDPAHPQPGRSSRERGQKQGQNQGQKETSRRLEDDLLREEDLHDENL
ncbi:MULTISPECIES: hypothetical protein [unclassified Streptomyces]|uniref:hypothetical protein n=1 Tax=unclassified Streptomyces TaxID=2593676 RepID=UPI0029BC010F|nr:hypothetical protein [Streptomyces sp. DK15]MDX2389350.1 hypothetical protein [Streptomyces sp. DK15]